MLLICLNMLAGRHMQNHTLENISHCQTPGRILSVIL